MTRHVAFLRAINLASKRRVAMADLRDELESLGYDDVATYIASGNAIFTATGKAAALEKAIEPALSKRFGFEIPTMVRTATQVRKVVALEPFGAIADGDHWYVTFLRSKPTAAAAKAVAALSNDIDTLEVHGTELHQLIHGSLLDSTVKAPALAKALGGIEGTNRNSTMLRKLLDKLEPVATAPRARARPRR
jgi:uncharacterized protein (DUF1697 family)